MESSFLVALAGAALKEKLLLLNSHVKMICLVLVYA